MPHGHWNTTTFLCGLRTTGLVAPLVLDSATNGPALLAYVRQSLARELLPGDVVVLDNLSSHKVSGVREAIEALGATLLPLPPYSPDLNPIELAFSKLKPLLRDTAEANSRGSLANHVQAARPLHAARVGKLPARLRLPTVRTIRV